MSRDKRAPEATVKTKLRWWTPRRVVIGLAALVLIAVGAGYGVLALMTAGAPAPASLPSPPPSSGPSGPWQGSWVVAPEKADFAGYRVREKLGFLPAPDDAVGRTRAVTGTLRIRGTTLVAAHLVADVTQLRSDQPPRDGALRQEGLQTDLHPRAVLDLAGPTPLGPMRRGRVIHARAPVRLQLRGVTRRTLVPFDARWNGSTLQIAGSATIRLADFGMEMSSRLEMRIAAEGRMEFELTLRRRAPRESPAGSAPAEPGEPTADRAEIAREPISRLRDPLLISARHSIDAPGADLYRVRADGRGLHRLTAQPHASGRAYDAAQPQPARDGAIVFARQLVFDRRDPAPTHLYVLHPGRAPAAMTRADVDDVTPALSPDGTHVAFARRSAPGLQRFQIWTARADGTGARRRSRTAGSDDSPGWSRDGTAIAFTCFTDTDHICRVGADGRDRRTLTHGDHYDSGPAYSPRDGTIAFSRDGHLALRHPDGRVTLLTHGRRTRDTLPAWSPDGRRLAFVRGDAIRDQTFTGPGRATIVDVAGGRVSRVPIAVRDVRSVSWVR
jgi:polyisoprenoid-binding protein YceI